MLSIWADGAIQSQLDGTTINAKVFAKISEALLPAEYEEKSAVGMTRRNAVWGISVLKAWSRV